MIAAEELAEIRLFIQRQCNFLKKQPTDADVVIFDQDKFTKTVTPQRVLAMLDRIASSDEEVTEFNMGFNDFKEGKPDIEPLGLHQDQWRLGYWWAQEESMKAQVKEQATEIERLRSACNRFSLADFEIEQTLGKVLNYPKSHPDVSKVDDGSVCVGEHVSRTIAAEAARKITELHSALFNLYAAQKTSGLAPGGVDYDRAMVEARRLMAMAPMDKCWDPKEWIEEMFENIVKNRGYEGWTLNWTTDEYCWRDKKRIDLNIESDPLEMALIHEVAHIKAPPDEDGNYHSVAFYEHMEKLAQQFLGRGIGDHDSYRRELAETRESKS